MANESELLVIDGIAINRICSVANKILPNKLEAEETTQDSFKTHHLVSFEFLILLNTYFD